MRISSKIAKAINDQIAYEASATHAYVAIGSWCERTGYDGSAAFFFEQANEENTHMSRSHNPSNRKATRQIQFTRIYIPSWSKK